MNDVPWAHTAVPLPPSQPPMPAVWRGRGSVLILLLKNLALNIVTLGFYRFWARTRLRRYLWSNVELLGDPFVYSGTGMELFKGFLRALVVIVPLGAISVGTDFIPDPMWMAAAKVPLVLLIFFLIFVAMYSARRYRLSRTTWRGIRFGLDGKATDYALRLMGWTLLTVVTLGFANPWVAVKEQKYLMERTFFGDKRFQFDGRGRELFMSWLLVYATFGLGIYWFAVKQFRYMTDHTALGEAHFASAARFWPIFGRILLFLATLGLVLLAFVALGAALAMQVGMVIEDLQENMELIAPFSPLLIVAVLALFGQLLIWPMVYIPVLRHVLATLSIANAASLAAIAQSAQSVPATGEGLADAFDVGLT